MFASYAKYCELRPVIYGDFMYKGYPLGFDGKRVVTTSYLGRGTGAHLSEPVLKEGWEEFYNFERFGRVKNE